MAPHFLIKIGLLLLIFSQTIMHLIVRELERRMTKVNRVWAFSYQLCGIESGMTAAARRLKCSFANSLLVNATHYQLQHHKVSCV